MKMRTTLLVLLILIGSVLAGAFASAATVPLQVEWVKINDGEMFNDSVYAPDLYRRGENLDVEVKVRALADVNNAQVEAYIGGYRYYTYESDLVSDVSRPFDLENNTGKRLSFKLQIPLKIEKKDALLRLRFFDENDEAFEKVYQLRIRGVDEEDAVQIKDFTISPSDVVTAGYPLSFKLRVKNYGDDDLDDVYAKVSIPELGISDDETLDELRADETETLEDLFLPIPRCANPGTYTVQAVVKFDEYEQTTATKTVTILPSDACEVQEQKNEPEAQAKTLIAVPQAQSLVAGGSGAVYPVMITNMGGAAKAYTLSVSGVDAWGTARFDPGNVVVVQPGGVATVYLYVAANEDVSGSQAFKLSVASDSESKDLVLTANITAPEKSADSLRRALEIGLIVLVIILILLGLIIGLKKLKSGSDEEEDEEAQTYY